MGAGANAVIIVLLLIIVFLVAYYNGGLAILSNLQSVQSFSSLNQNSIQQQPSGFQVLATCKSNVQSQINIISSQLPSGSIVNIVNSTVFYSTGDYPTTNMTINFITIGETYQMPENNFSTNINSWIQTWSEMPYDNGIPTRVNCYSGNYGNYNNAVPYMCADLKTLALEAANTNGSGVGAVGVVVRVQGNYGGSSESISYTNPLLCDSSGNLLQNSLGWIKNVPSDE